MIVSGTKQEFADNQNEVDVCSHGSFVHNEEEKEHIHQGTKKGMRNLDQDFDKDGNFVQKP